LLLDDYPTLTATDLANAWIYAEVYGEEITAEIRENIGSSLAGMLIIT
jgi:uncharacterized protein (DUF433 family)